MSKQQVWGPAEHAKGRAMHATACEIEAQRRAINQQESSAIMFDCAHQPASLETPDSVQTMLGKGCGKPLRSRTTLGKAKAAK